MVETNVSRASGYAAAPQVELTLDGEAECDSDLERAVEGAPNTLWERESANPAYWSPR